MTAPRLALSELCCPACRGDLFESDDGNDRQLRCGSCNRTYPVILSIPDFRLFPDPYWGLDLDRNKARRIGEIFGDHDFKGLLAFYYSMPDTGDTADQARMFTAGLLGAPARSAAALAAWQRLSGTPARGRLVEIGCGSAPLLPLARTRFAEVTGVDIALRWLVIARKRMEEAGCEVPLICANAEHLPFRDTTYDVVAGESAFEVTRDPPLALREALRVLRPGGALWLTTPNRWSLGPDPHVGVPAGGWWPKRLLDAWAKRQGALPPLRQFQSARSLRGLLRQSGFEDVRITLPDLPARQRATMPATIAAAAGVYQGVKDLPLARQVLLAVGPALLATATRPASA